MIRRCAWCGIVMPPNDAKPTEETTHGICLPCGVALAEDDFAALTVADDESRALDVGPWPMVMLLVVIGFLVLSSLLIGWRLLCAIS